MPHRAGHRRFLLDHLLIGCGRMVRPPDKIYYDSKYSPPHALVQESPMVRSVAWVGVGCLVVFGGSGRGSRFGHIYIGFCSRLVNSIERHILIMRTKRSRSEMDRSVRLRCLSCRLLLRFSSHLLVQAGIMTREALLGIYFGSSICGMFLFCSVL